MPLSLSSGYFKYNYTLQSPAQDRKAQQLHVQLNACIDCLKTFDPIHAVINIDSIFNAILNIKAQIDTSTHQASHTRPYQIKTITNPNNLTEHHNLTSNIHTSQELRLTTTHNRLQRPNPAPMYAPISDPFTIPNEMLSPILLIEDRIDAPITPGAPNETDISTTQLDNITTLVIKNEPDIPTPTEDGATIILDPLDILASHINDPNLFQTTLQSHLNTIDSRIEKLSFISDVNNKLGSNISIIIAEEMISNVITIVQDELTENETASIMNIYKECLTMPPEPTPNAQNIIDNFQSKINATAKINQERISSGSTTYERSFDLTHTLLCTIIHSTCKDSLRKYFNSIEGNMTPSTLELQKQKLNTLSTFLQNNPSISDAPYSTATEGITTFGEKAQEITKKLYRHNRSGASFQPDFFHTKSLTLDNLPEHAFEFELQVEHINSMSNGSIKRFWQHDMNFKLSTAANFIRNCIAEGVETVPEQSSRLIFQLQNSMTIDTTAQNQLTNTPETLIQLTQCFKYFSLNQNTMPTNLRNSLSEILLTISRQVPYTDAESTDNSIREPFIGEHDNFIRTYLARTNALGGSSFISLNHVPLSEWRFDDFDCPCNILLAKKAISQTIHVIKTHWDEIPEDIRNQLTKNGYDNITTLNTKRDMKTYFNNILRSIHTDRLSQNKTSENITRILTPYIKILTSAKAVINDTALLPD